MVGKITFVKNSSHDFDELDTRCMDRQSWAEASQKILDRTDLPINIVITGLDIGLYRAIGHKDFLRRINFVKKLDNDGLLPDKENRVNVILHSNSGQNRIPMTPWICIHRAVHAMQFQSALDTDGFVGTAGWAYTSKLLGKKGIRKKLLEDSIGMIEQTLTEFVKISDPNIKPLSNVFGAVAPPGYSNLVVQFAKLIGDTRTFRTGGKLNTNFNFFIDFWAETLTEKIVKGKMTIRVDAFKEHFDYNPKADQLIKYLEEMKTKSEDWFKQMVDNNIGEILVF
jgi:hypothetical protein